MSTASAATPHCDEASAVPGVKSIEVTFSECMILSRDELARIPITPFVRTWPRREMLLPITLDSLLPRGIFPLQLFKRVQRDMAVQLEVFGLVHDTHTEKAARY
jgi:hypothetical protein